MASATVTATMAAAGLDKRPSASSTLTTPGSGAFPSEMRSPLASSPGFLKQKENDLKTPITPPSAYLDFLKNMSPAIMSPALTSTSARFSINGDPDRALESPFPKSSISPPTSQPALSRNTSYDSTASTSTTSTNRSAASSRSNVSTVRIPPSAFAKPAPRLVRTPRKLSIPQSPFSATIPTAGLPSAMSLHSAKSVASPYSSTPLSAAPWSASFSPPDVDTEANGKPGKVTVKQVVTRTVTYCRTPLEAIPDGSLWKRRKVEHEGTPPKSVAEEPEVKQEKHADTLEDRTSEDTTPEQSTTAITVSPPAATHDA